VPPSIRHSNVVPASPAMNVKVGVAVFTAPVGPLLIVVSGTVASTVKVRVAGVGSGAPVTSTARISKVCAPSASVAVVNGDAQAANAAPSTRHWNATPASSALNVNVGAARRVSPDGPVAIVVSGGSAAITAVAADAALVLPAAFVAVTWTRTREPTSAAVSA
jgi:hypothetical protein